MIWILAKVIGLVLGAYLTTRPSQGLKIVGWVLIIIQLLDILVVLT
jgi:hypothetical protein